MTAKRKPKKKSKSPRRRDAPASILPFSAAPEFQATPGDVPLHELFQQQTLAMLERSDLSDEQKQSILIAMNCPCCGGSGLSFTMKLRRKK